MKIYGYTRVNSGGGAFGRESSTHLYKSEKERNEQMYQDYADAFDSLAGNEDFEEDEDGQAVDENGNPCESKEEFMKSLKRSKNVDQDVFGLIQCADFHVEYEPFSQEL